MQIKKIKMLNFLERLCLDVPASLCKEIEIKLTTPHRTDLVDARYFYFAVIQRLFDYV